MNRVVHYSFERSSVDESGAEWSLRREIERAFRVSDLMRLN